jgi:molybdopterin-guanine dinucleotide biosynthesis protein A
MVSASPSPVPEVTAVVLCGGESRRLGHGDKTQAALGSGSVLDALLRDLPAEWPVVAVGPQRETVRDVRWAREEPPGGGPVAAIAAGVACTTTPLVVVIGGDMPFAGVAAVALAARLSDQAAGEAGSEVAAVAGGEAAAVARVKAGVEAVAGRDHSGRLQPLLTAYRTEALRRVVPTPAEGVPAMRLLDGLRHLVMEVADPAALDVDTPEELDEARRRLGP